MGTTLSNSSHSLQETEISFRARLLLFWPVVSHFSTIFNPWLSGFTFYGKSFQLSVG